MSSEASRGLEEITNCSPNYNAYQENGRESVVESFIAPEYSNLTKIQPWTIGFMGEMSWPVSLDKLSQKHRFFTKRHLKIFHVY